MVRVATSKRLIEYLLVPVIAVALVAGCFVVSNFGVASDAHAVTADASGTDGESKVLPLASDRDAESAMTPDAALKPLATTTATTLKTLTEDHVSITKFNVYYAAKKSDGTPANDRIVPVYKVKYGKTTLKKDVDFTVSGDTSITAKSYNRVGPDGSFQLTFTGIGKYTGAVTVEFKWDFDTTWLGIPCDYEGGGYSSLERRKIGYILGGLKSKPYDAHFFVQDSSSEHYYNYGKYKGVKYGRSKSSCGLFATTIGMCMLKDKTIIPLSVARNFGAGFGSYYEFDTTKSTSPIYAAMYRNEYGINHGRCYKRVFSKIPFDKVREGLQKGHVFVLSVKDWKECDGSYRRHPNGHFGIIYGTQIINGERVYWVSDSSTDTSAAKSGTGHWKIPYTEEQIVDMIYCRPTYYMHEMWM